MSILDCFSSLQTWGVGVLHLREDFIHRLFPKTYIDLIVQCCCFSASPSIVSSPHSDPHTEVIAAFVTVAVEYLSPSFSAVNSCYLVLSFVFVMCPRSSVT